MDYSVRLNILKLIDLNFEKEERERMKLKNLCYAIHLVLKFLMDNPRKKKLKRFKKHNSRFL